MSGIDPQNRATLESLGMLQQQKKQTQGSSDLGQDQFMELMLAQMRNQDPLKPMENGEFIAQLAQFSTVSGVNGLQKSFDSLAASLQSNQALQASTLVGRTVSVPSETGVLPQGGNLEGTLSLPSSASGVNVEIKNSAGQLVKRLDLGTLASGEHDFSWSGVAEDGTDMPAGEYTLSATAVIDGTSTALETHVSANVESVDLKGSGGIQLNLAGLGSREFSDVIQIK